ncbi:MULTISPECIES: hypothetical protein [Okeania]|uniref:Uncharacterized protein n=1 Tax=Okeania hirsuta TaxID=1458930 RepID=A0A3N6PKW0_9CYAN|nr:MULTISPECIES: hypothetical protein [Okeania]NES90738.1 hypothetical protein [Okeania sp. SIO2B9]RQH14512.1 hypothetical protein D4Z78_22330 [Okeania hirsuta]RQH56533.1 hypothetical protein D5R40_01440 [Okeania hirsuta]
MTILLLKQLGLISVIPIFLIISFEYPSLSKNYTQNQKISDHEANNILKLNKPQSTKLQNQPANKYLKNRIEVSENGCIIKNLRLRNGMKIKIRQNCN